MFTVGCKTFNGFVSFNPKAQTPKLVLYQKWTTTGRREINSTQGDNISSCGNQNNLHTLEAQFNGNQIKLDTHTKLYIIYEVVFFVS